MEEMAPDLSEFWDPQTESTVEFVLLSEGKLSFKLNHKVKPFLIHDSLLGVNNGSNLTK